MTTDRNLPTRDRGDSLGLPTRCSPRQAPIRRRSPRAGSRIGWGVLGIVAVAAIWELYKFSGPLRAGRRCTAGESGSGSSCPARTTARCRTSGTWSPGCSSRPAAATPRRCGSRSRSAALVTLGIAAVGWLIGVVGRAILGLADAAVAPRRVGPAALDRAQPDRAAHRLRPGRQRDGARRSDRGALPGRNGCRSRSSRRYLAFFPVAVGALRGLARPTAIHVDLMRTYAAGYWPTIWPAAAGRRARTCCRRCGSPRPTRCSARSSPRCRSECAAASAGCSSSSPVRPPATPPHRGARSFGSIALGLVAAGSVALIGLWLRNYRRGEAHGMTVPATERHHAPRKTSRCAPSASARSSRPKGGEVHRAGRRRPRGRAPGEFVSLIGPSRLRQVARSCA